VMRTKFNMQAEKCGNKLKEGWDVHFRIVHTTFWIEASKQFPTAPTGKVGALLKANLQSVDVLNTLFPPIVHVKVCWET
jgi:hypothetical protein